MCTGSYVQINYVPMEAALKRYISGTIAALILIARGFLSEETLSPRDSNIIWKKSNKSVGVQAFVVDYLIWAD